MKYGRNVVHTTIDEGLLLVEENLDETVVSVEYWRSTVCDCNEENVDVIRESIVMESNAAIELVEKDSCGTVVSWNDRCDVSVELFEDDCNENVK